MGFVSIFFIQLFGLLTPGPDFFLVTRTGLTGNKIAIFQVVSGICLGAFIWASLSLLGLHALFQYYPILNKIILFLGSGYLFYLSYSIYQYAMSTDVEHQPQKSKALSSYFLTGFLTNISNPKAIIYYSSIFSVLPLGHGLINLGSILAFIMVESFICFVCVGFIFSHSKIKVIYQGYARMIDLASAGIFCLFAILMAIKLFL